MENGDIVGQSVAFTPDPELNFCGEQYMTGMNENRAQPMSGGIGTVTHTLPNSFCLLPDHSCLIASKNGKKAFFFWGTQQNVLGAMLYCRRNAISKGH